MPRPGAVVRYAEQMSFGLVDARFDINIYRWCGVVFSCLPSCEVLFARKFIHPIDQVGGSAFGGQKKSTPSTCGTSVRVIILTTFHHNLFCVSCFPV